MPERHWQHNCPTRAGTSTGTRDGEACDLCHANPPSDVPALCAEVRRLRELVKLLEWGSCDGCGQRNRCTECKADRMGEWDDAKGEMVGAGRHKSDCPAFTESGDVR
jgi:hypothetical protein